MWNYVSVNQSCNKLNNYIEKNKITNTEHNKSGDMIRMLLTVFRQNLREKNTAHKQQAEKGRKRHCIIEKQRTDIPQETKNHSRGLCICIRQQKICAKRKQHDCYCGKICPRNAIHFEFILHISLLPIGVGASISEAP